MAIQHTRSTVSDASYRRYELAVRLFLDSVGFKKLASVNQQDFVKFRDSLLDEGRSATTVNLLSRTILRIPFRLAFNSGLISCNPAALLKPIKAAKTHRGVFTPNQIDMLLAA